MRFLIYDTKQSDGKNPVIQELWGMGSVNLLPSQAHPGSECYLPNPSTRAGYDTRSVFKRNLRGLNSEFSFS